MRKRIAVLLESQKEGALQTGGPVPEVAMEAMVPDIRGIASLHGWLTSTGQAQYTWEEGRRKEAWRAWVAKAWPQHLLRFMPG